MTYIRKLFLYVSMKTIPPKGFQLCSFDCSARAEAMNNFVLTNVKESKFVNGV